VRVPAWFTIGDQSLSPGLLRATDWDDLKQVGVLGWHPDGNVVDNDHAMWCEIDLDDALAAKIERRGCDVAYPGWAAVGDVPWVARNRPLELNEGHRILWHRIGGGNLWIGIDPKDVENQARYEDEMALEQEGQTPNG
jgi:hypothetical protein